VRRLFVCAAVLLTLATCHHEQPAAVPRRVIFVGLDGGDWQLLDRFMADGTMPNLRTLVAEGERRILRTEHPPLSPLVWTTMMTGVGPLDHRILDFTRFNPVSRQKEPITSDERAVPALWNMVSSRGGRVAVFGLWASYPAEPVNGSIVSDRLFSYQYDSPPPPGSVSPAGDEATALATLRTIDSSIGFDAVQSYVPALTRTEYEGFAAGQPFDHPETALRRILVETEVVHRLARERIAADRPNLAVVYFQGTDAVGHLFASYFPPKLAQVSEAAFERYRDVPRRYFARIDALLGDFRKLAEEEGAELVVASDHGFLWGEGRSSASSLAVATAARWHRDDGIYLHWQPPALRSGNQRSTPPAPMIQARELCPTLLTLLGLPSDITTYRRAYRAQAARTSTGDPEAIAKLRALGYLGGGEPSQAPAGASTRTAGSFNNEGLLLREAGRDQDALAAFENGLRVDPRSASSMWNLAELLRKTHGNETRAAALLDGALAVEPNQPRWLLTRGRMRLEQHDCTAALADFTRATALAPNDPLAHASAATAHLCLGHDAEAREEIERSLALDPDQPALRRALQ
jgi:tetratricopeptide (TPR) repeat protein